MKMRRNLIDLEHESLFQTYKRLPIVVDRAKGCRITDKEGVSYLDFLSGIAVNALGHSHPKIISAVKTQLGKYMHLSNYFYQEPQVQLGLKLKELTGLDRVFFTNSGAEAIEGAIKLARKWGSSYKKSEIIAFSGGFHGRTYGALSMMDKPAYKEKMGPFLPNMKIIPYNDIQALKENINSKTAAVALEFIQGEGGVSSADADFINELFALKDKHRFLVIADEIQTGAGRTGKFCAFEHYIYNLETIKPDIVTLAKGIGGGLPLGAILAREFLHGIWEKGAHGTTFGGNAVACAAGLVVVNELQHKLLKHVEKVGSYLKQKLQQLKLDNSFQIKEIRGRGLLQGLLLNFEASKLVALLLEKRIISNATSGNVLRIIPPLIVTESEIDEFISALGECLQNNYFNL